jgi:hypothetical protein
MRLADPTGTSDSVPSISAARWTGFHREIPRIVRRIRLRDAFNFDTRLRGWLATRVELT